MHKHFTGNQSYFLENSCRPTGVINEILIKKINCCFWSCFVSFFFWNFFFVINLNFDLLISSVKKTGSFTYITMPWERYQYMYITYAQAFHWKSIIFFRKFLTWVINEILIQNINFFFVLFCFLFCFFLISFLSLTWILISLYTLWRKQNKYI